MIQEIGGKLQRARKNAGRYGGQLIVPTNVIAEAIRIRQLEDCLMTALHNKEIE